jgi:uncharacterized protein YdcH (DUF465 family)
MNAADAHEGESPLLEGDDDYRQLVEQHHQLESQLQQFTTRQYLSTSDHVEEVALKKRKLALKDRIATMTRQHAHGGPGH